MEQQSLTLLENIVPYLLLSTFLLIGFGYNKLTGALKINGAAWFLATAGIIIFIRTLLLLFPLPGETTTLESSYRSGEVTATYLPASILAWYLSRKFKGRKNAL